MGRVCEHSRALGAPAKSAWWVVCKIARLDVVTGQVILGCLCGRLVAWFGVLSGAFERAGVWCSRPAAFLFGAHRSPVVLFSGVNVHVVAVAKSN